MSVMRIKKVVTKLGMLHKESWSKKKKNGRYYDSNNKEIIVEDVIGHIKKGINKNIRHKNMHDDLERK